MSDRSRNNQGRGGRSNGSRSNYGERSNFGGRDGNSGRRNHGGRRDDRGGSGDSNRGINSDRYESRGSIGGRGNGGSRDGSNRGGQRRHRGARQSFDSGNKRERITVESGHLVLIDQFMLANPRFYERFLAVIDEEPKVKDEVILQYGGKVIDLTPGTYKIQRNPYKLSILIHPEEGHLEDLESELEQGSLKGESIGEVFLDTRCLALIDKEMLDDQALLEKYQQLWFSGQDKACRDLLRDNGGAVRYGFSRFHDNLQVEVFVAENTVRIMGTATMSDIPENEEGATPFVEEIESIAAEI